MYETVKWEFEQEQWLHSPHNRLSLFQKEKKWATNWAKEEPGHKVEELRLGVFAPQIWPQSAPLKVDHVNDYLPSCW